MKQILLLIFLIIIVSLVIYLNRAYAHFYDSLEFYHLTPPLAPASRLVISAAPGDIKYIALGDSLSAGVGADNILETFPESYTRILKQKTNRIRLKNLAQPGANSIDLLSTQLPEAIQEQPGLITLLIGINDIHNLVSPETFERNYRQILKELTTQTFAQIKIINIPLLGSDKILYPPYNLLLDLRTRQFNRIIDRLAAEFNLKVVDLYARTKDEFKKDSRLYSPDQFHPSNEGYKLWVEIINED